MCGIRVSFEQAGEGRTRTHLEQAGRSETVDGPVLGALALCDLGGAMDGLGGKETEVLCRELDGGGADCGREDASS